MSWTCQGCSTQSLAILPTCRLCAGKKPYATVAATGGAAKAPTTKRHEAKAATKTATSTATPAAGGNSPNPEANEDGKCPLTRGQLRELLDTGSLSERLEGLLGVINKGHNRLETARAVLEQAKAITARSRRNWSRSCRGTQRAARCPIPLWTTQRLWDLARALRSGAATDPVSLTALLEGLTMPFPAPHPPEAARNGAADSDEDDEETPFPATGPMHVEGNRRARSLAPTVASSTRSRQKGRAWRRRLGQGSEAWDSCRPTGERRTQRRCPSVGSLCPWLQCSGSALGGDRGSDPPTASDPALLRRLCNK